MANTLVRYGVLSADDRRRLEALLTVRTQIVHGFVAGPAADADAARFLRDTGRRLLAPAGQQAAA